VNVDRFWQKASDLYNLHHDKYRRAVLTDEEALGTVTDFLTDVEGLAGEWYNPEEYTGKEGNKQWQPE
tara:strand:+ start:6708 stop:6911 length:204 start_codon:yes stop_codon:yes gene_type:complete